MGRVKDEIIGRIEAVIEMVDPCELTQELKDDLFDHLMDIVNDPWIIEGHFTPRCDEARNA